MSKGSLLIVSPAFHHYWHPIQAAFQRRGWQVTTACYDLAPTTTSKLRVKLNRELPALLGRPESAASLQAHSLVAAAAVTEAGPDRVLVIKGDTLSDPFYDALERTRVPRSLWLYDELRRTQHTDATLARYDSIASYSPADTAALSTQGLSATHVPLAYDADLTFTATPVPEVTLIGARYPSREDTLKRLATAGIPVRAFGRQWSDHPFDRLRTWRVRSTRVPNGRDVSRQQAYGLMAGSPATLNLHSDQDGFTMRTFEAAGAGGVQLIDRADVTSLYDPGAEVLPFGSIDELIELARRAIADSAWAKGIRSAARQRTLAEHTFDHRVAAIESTWV